MKIRAPESSSPKKQVRTNRGFFLHLDRVETMRCFWELKLIELQGHFQQKITEDVEYKLGELPERKRSVASEQHVCHGFLPVAQTLGFTFLPQEAQILGKILVIFRCAVTHHVVQVENLSF
ncbi:myosin light chain kinase 2, skeletal/cardiac muscle isoform X3 [Tachysurus ichikawai]